MRWSTVVLLALCALPAWGAEPGDAIVEVLDRSQQMQIDRLPLADTTIARARMLRDFDTLLRAIDLPHPVELRIVTGDIVGEALKGRVVVVNVSMAGLPEGERLFILAHEVGHVSLDHWTQMGSLYRRWVPGEVVRAQTDAIARDLGREASALAHQQEFAADAFALRTLRRLGHRDDEALATFLHLGMRGDTLTHPGTLRRMAALQAVMHADAQVAQGRMEAEGDPR